MSNLKSLFSKALLAVALATGAGIASAGPTYHVSLDTTSFSGDGKLTTTWPNATGVALQSLYVQPDGRILLGGSPTHINGTPSRGLGRLNADGSTDTTFNPGLGAPNGRMPSGSRMAICSSRLK